MKIMGTFTEQTFLITNANYKHDDSQVYTCGCQCDRLTLNYELRYEIHKIIYPFGSHGIGCDRVVSREDLKDDECSQG